MPWVYIVALAEVRDQMNPNGENKIIFHLNSTEFSLLVNQLHNYDIVQKTLRLGKIHLIIYLTLRFIWLNIYLLTVENIFFLVWPEICVFHFPFQSQERMVGQHTMC